MASIISITSFLILLLATFSYSVPIGQTYGNSTVGYQYTTDQPMVYQGQSIDIFLTANNNTANATIIYTDLSSEVFNSTGVTGYNVTHSPRTLGGSADDSSDFEDLSEGSYEESSVPSSTQTNGKRTFNEDPSSAESESKEKRSDDQFAESSSAENTDKRSVEEPSPSSSNEKRASEESSSESESSEKRSDDQFASSSVEEAEKRSANGSSISSPTYANKKQPQYRKPFKTILPKTKSSGNSTSYRKPLSRPAVSSISAQAVNKRTVEDFESSETFNQRAIRPFHSEEDVESSTMFGVQNQTETNAFSSVENFGKYTGLFLHGQNSTSEYETTDSPVQSSRLTKTVSVIPGKISKTTIYGNAPNNFLQGDQQQQQLSQVQNQ